MFLPKHLHSGSRKWHQSDRNPLRISQKKKKRPSTASHPTQPQGSSWRSRSAKGRAPTPMQGSVGHLGSSFCAPKLSGAATAPSPLNLVPCSCQAPELQLSPKMCGRGKPKHQGPAPLVAAAGGQTCTSCKDFEGLEQEFE